MAAPFFSTPFQPFIYQSPEAAFIPFQILGGEAQIVQIMLKSQERVTAKPVEKIRACFDTLTTKGVSAEGGFNPAFSVDLMETNPSRRFSSYFAMWDAESGFAECIQTNIINSILAPKGVSAPMSLWRWLFGRSMTSIALLNPGPHDGFVGIAAPSLARIIPIDLATFGGEILCQPDAFLCSVNDVTITSTIDQRARNVVAGGEGILKQKLVGRGLAFLVAGGSVVQKNLDVGEVLVVDASCIVAMTGTVDFQVKYSGPMRRVVFGGDNLLTAVLTGPGIVFVQSLPFHRFSQRVARAVTSPSMRENPKFFIQIVIFFFLAYVMIVSSLILTDV